MIKLVGCSVCNPDSKSVYQKTRYISVTINTRDGASALNVDCDGVCPDNAHCALKNVPAKSAFIINYCPECGRKLSK